MEESYATEMEIIKKKKERLLQGRRSVPKSINNNRDPPDSTHSTTDKHTSQLDIMHGKSGATQESENENLNIKQTPKNECGDNETVPSRDRKASTSKQRHEYCRKLHFGSVWVAIILIGATAVVLFGFMFTNAAKMRDEITSLKETVKSNYSAVNNLDSLYQHLLNTSGYFSFSPAPSCAALLSLFPSTPSGYYWVRASNVSAVYVYCDMTRACGGITGGWMRVAELDMTDSNQQCPRSLVLSSVSNIRTCKRMEDSSGCSSTFFSTADIPYAFKEICGRVLAYQVNTTNAFAAVGNSRPRGISANISDVYVDGVSLTHGNPRQHIWSFAAGLDEVGTVSSESTCPCNNDTEATSPPPFVGGDYFCEAGIRAYNRSHTESGVYSNDPLWDGHGCIPSNACCSFNNPPWFYKKLPQPTTDNIEMRVCRDENSHNEDLAISAVDIYVR